MLAVDVYSGKSALELHPEYLGIAIYLIGFAIICATLHWLISDAVAAGIKKARDRARIHRATLRFIRDTKRRPE